MCHRADALSVIPVPVANGPILAALPGVRVRRLAGLAEVVVRETVLIVEAPGARVDVAEPGPGRLAPVVGALLHSDGAGSAHSVHRLLRLASLSRYFWYFFFRRFSSRMARFRAFSRPRVGMLRNWCLLCSTAC